MRAAQQRKGKMNEAMQKLIDAVQKASPVVWQAAYRQVWIDGIESLILLLGFICGGITLLKFAKYLQSENAEEVGIFFAYLGSVGSFLLTIPCLICVLDDFFNPTFAAIKNLKGLL